jgi:hypothetical protein
MPVSIGPRKKAETGYAYSDNQRYLDFLYFVLSVATQKLQGVASRGADEG